MTEVQDEHESRKVIDSFIRTSKSQGIYEYVLAQDRVTDDWKRYFQKFGISIYGQHEIPNGHRPANAILTLPDEAPE